jgi:hypothetical protein
MSSPIKRREFLTLGVALSGAVVAGQVHGDSGVSPVQSAVPEGIALVSVAYARAGYQLTPAVADEVRKKLSSYPSDFAAARALTLPNSVGPSMHLTPAFHVIPVANTGPTPVKKPAVPAVPSVPSNNIPSDNDVKPLPVPAGAQQN